MSFASLFSFPPENILTLVAPHFFGNMHSVEYWGRSYYWEATAFVGVGAVVLAVAGFAHGASQRRRLWLTMALLLFVIALGGYTPLFVLLYKYVPGFARFRSHNRFIYESTLFAALLASAGLDAILQGVKISRAVVMAAWVLAAIVGVLAAAAWVPPGSIEHFAILAHPAQVLAQTSLGIAAAVAILAAIAVSLCSRSHRWGYALALLAVIELVSFGRTMVTTFRLSNACPPVLQAWRRAHPGDFRVLQLAYPYDSAMALGAYEVWGYDPVVLRRYSELLTASQGGDVNNPRMSLSFDRPTSVVRLLGCRYLLAKMPGRVVAYPIYGALPPASIIYSYYLLQDRNQIFDLLLSPSFDGRGVVVLERRPGIALGQPTATPSVSLKWLDTDSMEVEATTQAAGILLVNETYSHFWRATALPGSVQQSYAIQPGDYTQIAIPVQAGRHRIYLNYCPPLFKVGADLSILALIAFLGLTIYVWRSPVPKAARQ